MPAPARAARQARATAPSMPGGLELERRRLARDDCERRRPAGTGPVEPLQDEGHSGLPEGRAAPTPVEDPELAGRSQHPRPRGREDELGDHREHPHHQAGPGPPRGDEPRAQPQRVEPGGPTVGERDGEGLGGEGEGHRRAGRAGDGERHEGRVGPRDARRDHAPVVLEQRLHVTEGGGRDDAEILRGDAGLEPRAGQREPARADPQARRATVEAEAAHVGVAGGLEVGDARSGGAVQVGGRLDGHLPGAEGRLERLDGVAERGEDADSR